MPRQTGLSAADEILLAAAELSPDSSREFSEWDLTVKAWERNRPKFGCRGYEEKFPDHKRVMMEIMSKKKQSNPLRRGFMAKGSRPNYYKITPLGLAEAERLSRRSEGLGAPAGKASAHYDSIKRYAKHSVFEAYLKDPQEPKTWLGAAAFFGITQYTALELNDKLTAAENAVKRAHEYLQETKAPVIRRGPTGGDKAISRETITALDGFIRVLHERFTEQIQAIRRKG